jgi:hypothetical protein
MVAMQLAKYDAKVQIYTAKLLYGCTQTIQSTKREVTVCTNNLEQSQFCSLRLDINNVEQRAFSSSLLVFYVGRA